MVVVMTLTAVPMSGFVGLELPKWSEMFVTKASATDEYTEGYLKYSVEDGEATITDCDESIKGEFVIPGTLGGYPVTEIRYSAFYDCSSFTSITIPYGVTSIGSFAFSGCSSLTRITIPDSVTSIGSYAFNDCTGLTNFIIPDNITCISVGMFRYCTSLNNITIPGSITCIDSDAFCGCTGLTSIIIPDSVTKIEAGAFLDCTGLTSVSLGNGVTYIGGGLSELDSGAFQNCSGLTEITIPDSVTTIDDSAFSNCTGLKKVTIGKGITRINSFVFCDCSNLSSVIIPDGIISIGWGAFKRCRRLGSIAIPDSVTSIGVAAFDDTAWYEAQPYGDVYAGRVYYEYKTHYTASLNRNVIIKDGTKGIADGAFSETSITSVTIPDSVTSIGAYAFSETSITSVTIPDSVTSIGAYAFSDCINLKSVSIGRNITRIGYEAFRDCTGLKSVNIFDLASWCNIDFDYDSNPLYYANDLYVDNVLATDISIPDGIICIGDYTFYGCTSLTSVKLPDSVTSIGYSAFEDCTGLTSAIIGNSVTSIGCSAFDGTAWYDAQPDGNVYAGKVYYKYKGTMPGNTSIVIKDGTKGIAGAAFNDCDGLTSVTIPDSVTSIGDFAFSDCTGLTSITIPDCVTSIGDSAFSKCSGLTSITIPESVISIGDSVFKNCAGLTKVNWNAENVINCGESVFANSGIAGNGIDVVFGENVKRIPDYAFYVDYYDDEVELRIKSVTIGNSVTSIGDAAFSWGINLDNVYYFGTEEQWETISILPNNESLLNATIHFSYTHSYVSTITKPATCTASGVMTYTCICGDSYTKIIPATGHTEVTDKAVAATCTKAGLTEGKHCSVCGEVIDAQKTVAKTAHTYKTTTTKATTSKDGKTVTACTVCKAVSKTVVIPKVTFFKLSKTSYTYNGKAQTPTVTVKDSKGKTLKNGTDYTVIYASGRKNTGKYAVTVTLKGNYSGNKTLYFNILPGKTSKLTATQTTSSVKATWKAVTGASGYKVILYSAKNKALKTVDTTKTTYTFTKLSKGTTYKVKVTAYKTIDGKKVLSGVNTILTTTTKPATPTLSVTAGAKKATLKWNKQTGATGYIVYMATSKSGKFSKIATLKGNSKISYTKTGLTKGKTYYFKVCAYTTAGGKSVNGAYSAVKSVKVK